MANRLKARNRQVAAAFSRSNPETGVFEMAGNRKLRRKEAVISRRLGVA